VLFELVPTAAYDEVFTKEHGCTLQKMFPHGSKRLRKFPIRFSRSRMEGANPGRMNSLVKCGLSKGTKA
jgi:hypothetical protein